MSQTATNYSEKIAAIQTQITQLENRRKELLQRGKAQERKVRTRRLIERGAIAESLTPGAEEMTNDQFKSHLEAALSAERHSRIVTDTEARGGARADETGGDGETETG